VPVQGFPPTDSTDISVHPVNAALSSAGVQVLGGVPFGINGNWGYKASRFPQAWNLAEAVRRLNSPVDVAVMDSGFATNPAAPPSLTLPGPTDLCTFIADPTTFQQVQKCVANPPGAAEVEHGTNVGSIIQAGDPALRAGQLHGISYYQFRGCTTSSNCSRFDEIRPGGQLADVRVLNLSIGVANFIDPATGLLRRDSAGNEIWWKHCGPANPNCTPNDDTAKHSPHHQQSAGAATRRDPRQRTPLCRRQSTQRRGPPG
jgi:hypothetical protein